MAFFEGLIYNIDFELAAIVILMVAIAVTHTQSLTESESNRRFIFFTYATLAAAVMDTVTAISISWAANIPNWLNMMLNTAYFACAVLAPFSFWRYITAHIRRGSARKTPDAVNEVIFLLCEAFVVVNFFTGWVFSFDDEHTYIHGPAYIMFYLGPTYFVVAGVIAVIANRGAFRRNQFISAVSFIFITLFGPVIQMLLFQSILITAFLGAVALLFMMFSLETPDYHNLISAMIELREARETADAAREEAQAANSVKSVFLENISHEIRTPINAVLGYNEMIEKETREPRTAEYSRNIRSATLRLLSMFNDVMDFTQIDEGRLVIEDRPYSVRTLLNDSLVFGKLSAEEKGLEFRYSIDGNIPQMLTGDCARLSQIISNLISNALKFTTEGFVGVEAGWQAETADMGRLVIRITDSGIGMMPEDIRKISQSFSRFDNRRTRNIQGLGLGLTIVTRLLELMGSRLEIESEYEKGSTFGFSVKAKVHNAAPIGRLELGAAAEKTAPEADGDITAPNARILSVDDNPMNLNLFTGVLRSTGMQIDTAENGEEALRLIKANKYDIIFLDHMMPVMDGEEVLRRLRADHLCDNTPVIVITANASGGARERYLNAGFDDYISKPVDIDRLRSIIRRLLPEKLLCSAQTEQKIPREEAPQSQTAAHSLEERFSFLDTAAGMKYCCGSEEFYIEMMNTYLTNGRQEDIERYYAEEDWENYRIQVHALKSTSLTIGAAALSEEAKALEFAAKDNNTEYIKAHHGELMEHYRKLLSDLSGALGTSSEDKQAEFDYSEAAQVPTLLAVSENTLMLKLAEQLAGENAELYCVKTAADAERFLSIKKADAAVVFDNGGELTKDVCALGVPVLAVSADAGAKQKLLSAGAAAFAELPFSEDLLKKKLDSILS